MFGQISSFYAQSGFIPLSKSALSDKFYFNGNNSIWHGGHSDNEKGINANTDKPDVMPNRALLEGAS
ncbi:hypothetical protein QW180_00660 [Vibrio sinaloensis]|nr:hypothetical protein [Vibrio sinaloensis]